MKRREVLTKALIAGGAVAVVARGRKARAALPSDGTAAAAGPEYVALPGFAKDSAVTLDQALLKRATVRSYAEDAKLSPEQVSRLLWATTGVNREDGHRTTPSAMATYPIDVYVGLPEGVYLFEPKPHRLKKISGQDIRAEIPLQGAFKKAAMLVLYVARPKLGNGESWADLEIGCMVQNLFLEAAALGMGSAVFGLNRPDRAAELLQLKSGEKFRIAQVVGPKK